MLNKSLISSMHTIVAVTTMSESTYNNIPADWLTGNRLSDYKEECTGRGVWGLPKIHANKRWLAIEAQATTDEAITGVRFLLAKILRTILNESL